MSSARAGAAIGALVTIVVQGVVGSNEAWSTTTDRCVAAKIKAAGKAVYAKTRCHQRALLAGVPVDPACLAKADGKLAAALGAAEGGGPCPGIAKDLEDDVAAAVDALAADVAVTPVTTTTTTTTTLGTVVDVCCQGTSVCTDIMASPGDCTVLGTMTPGAGGSSCDGTTGACATGTPPPGPCCQIAGLPCLAGPSLGAANCASLSGTFYAAATCTPSGCVP